MKSFLTKTSELVVGNPADEKTDVGPMIHTSEVKRVKEWLDTAISAGATVEIGGNYENNLFEPTVVSKVDPQLAINCQEVFAPLVVVHRYTDIEDAFRQVNDSDYGLQAGIFTKDAKVIFTAYEALDVGAVTVGEVPTYRIDHMPYGGTKQSGLGREGVRFAIEAMTETKLLVMNI
jgi:glyceraldehyde-3-phosphate dehydrogenase (NADP+)